MVIILLYSHKDFVEGVGAGWISDVDVDVIDVDRKRKSIWQKVTTRFPSFPLKISLSDITTKREWWLFMESSPSVRKGLIIIFYAITPLILRIIYKQNKQSFSLLSSFFYYIFININIFTLFIFNTNCIWWGVVEQPMRRHSQFHSLKSIPTKRHRTPYPNKYKTLLHLHSVKHDRRSQDFFCIWQKG